MPKTLNERWHVLPRSLDLELRKLHLLGVGFAKCSWSLRLAYDNNIHRLGVGHVAAHFDCDTILFWLLSVALDRCQFLV